MSDDSGEAERKAALDEVASIKSMMAFKLMLTMLAARPTEEHPAIMSAVMGTHVLAMRGMDDEAAMAYYDGPMRNAVRDTFDMVRAMNLIGECDCSKCKAERAAKAQGKSEGRAANASANPNPSTNSNKDTGTESERTRAFKAILARMKEGAVH